MTKLSPYITIFKRQSNLPQNNNPHKVVLNYFINLNPVILNTVVSTLELTVLV